MGLSDRVNEPAAHRHGGLQLGQALVPTREDASHTGCACATDCWSLVMCLDGTESCLGLSVRFPSIGAPLMEGSI